MPLAGRGLGRGRELEKLLWRLRQAAVLIAVRVAHSPEPPAQSQEPFNLDIYTEIPRGACDLLGQAVWQAKGQDSGGKCQLGR